MFSWRNKKIIHGYSILSRAIMNNKDCRVSFPSYHLFIIEVSVRDFLIADADRGHIHIFNQTYKYIYSCHSLS